MNGLINKAMQQTQSPDLPLDEKSKSGLNDENLRQIDTQIESSVPQESRQMYNGIVAAGMRMAFDPKMQDKLMQGLQSSQDVVKNISLIVTGIVSMVYTESKQDANQFAQAMVPASISLMCDILQFASDAGMIELTPETIAQCASSTSKAVLAKFGIGEEQIKSAVEAGRQASGQSPALGMVA